MPHFLLPVSPGRNLATLVETAVRVYLLRLRGYNAAHRLVARHSEMLGVEESEGGAKQSKADDGDDGAGDGL